MGWYVYILFCDQKIYYVGSTNNVNRRLIEHQAKQSNFTHKFSDIKLVYSEKLESKEKALARETQIKGWTSAKKKAIIDGDLELLRELCKKH
ncbi:MAG: GIY-YIG nuclease family protein [Candidatus Shapirobacteria bacterium]